MQPKRYSVIDAQELKLTSGKSYVGMAISSAFAFGLFGLALAMRDPVFILVMGFFAFAFAGGLVMMWRAQSSQNRFGELPLWLEEPRPTVCGHLTASLPLPMHVLAKARTVHGNLVCINVTYGKQRSMSERAVRGVRMVAPVSAKGAGGKVTLTCVIPDGLPPANDPGVDLAEEDSTYVKWQLKMSVQVGSDKLERTYLIPVGEKLPGAVAPEPARTPEKTLRSEPRRAVASSRPAAMPSPAVEATPVEAPAPADRSSLWLLVLMNMPAVAGVWFFGWQVRDVVLLYWIENIVIGLFNLLRIAVAVPDTLPDLQRRGIDFSSGDVAMAKMAAGAFFLAHYGAFCATHGIVLAMLFASSDSIAEAFKLVAASAMGLVAVIGIVLSHAYSFRHNYIVRGEYEHVDFTELMTRPYKRILVTHFFILFGAWLLLGSGNPAAAIVIFIAIKICFDAWSHRREHAGGKA